MSNRSDQPTTAGDDGAGAAEKPRVLLFMREGQNRKLLLDALGDRYRIETTTDPSDLGSAFDCCLVGHTEFSRIASAIEQERESADHVLPFVLLVPESDADAMGSSVWKYVDDVIELPVAKAALRTRIGNQIDRRQTAAELAARTGELERVVEDLRLKERAMDEATIGIVVTDPHQEDNPIVYVNERFEEITGYDSTEAFGRNCRFLQGEDTDPETRRVLREHIDAAEPVSVDIVNYRKTGERIWQNIDISPVHNDEGEVTNFVGFQSEITDWKLKERRLDVLNRVLSHNLKNKMNVIEGHVELLRDEFADGEEPRSLDIVTDAAVDLMGLAESVQEIERIISVEGSSPAAIDLTADVLRIVDMLSDHYPDATISTDLPDEECLVELPGIVAAIEEAIENGIKHNDSPTPWVAVRMTKRDDGWIDIEIEDDGPGIPDHEIAVLKGGETPLEHAERLGLWMIYWVITKAGGRFNVATTGTEGSVIELSVPGHDVS
ncbi:PAS domain-containing protein [Haloplanus sp. C73]|uniref:PAS domain-containing protein n=1 Tax=Haloplanus sp. C73 TaxID=3421641 RepID=UPI003EBE02D3